MNQMNKKATQPRHVAQCKTTVSAQSNKRPVAPPVYRPQSALNVLLRKVPVAPPVYRPQPAPRVLQKKSSMVLKPETANARGQQLSAPAVYRPEAKKIVQPKAISPQKKAISRPDQQRIVPPGIAFRVKPPVVQHTKIPQPATIQRAVVQRAKRDMLEYKLDYVLVPDKGMESYTAHVKKRTRHFFTVVLNAIFEMQAQGGKVGPGMFTDHAAAQEASGFRLGKEPESKIDAAHLMNVTLVPGKFPKVNAKVADLYIQSAATTMEFQKANIGPDKHIDSQQSRTKNAMLKSAGLGTPVNALFLAGFVNDYLTTLKGALTVPLPEPEGVLSQARAAAMRAIVEDLENIQVVLVEIQAELGKKLA
ncbi:MAG: hypothetical protein V7638_1326 [Acidobacteriota bacterium]|jgi:hypothetical protein